MLDPKREIRKGLGYGFRGPKGEIYMHRCFHCGRENWMPAVATGRCAWCDFDANKEKPSGRGPA